MGTVTSMSAFFHYYRYVWTDIGGEQKKKTSIKGRILHMLRGFVPPGDNRVIEELLSSGPRTTPFYNNYRGSESGRLSDGAQRDLAALFTGSNILQVIEQNIAADLDGHRFPAEHVDEVIAYLRQCDDELFTHLAEAAESANTPENWTFILKWWYVYCMIAEGYRTLPQYARELEKYRQFLRSSSAAVENFLADRKIPKSAAGASFCAEINFPEGFHETRSVLLQACGGTLSLVGPTLRDAFNADSDRSILKQLSDRIECGAVQTLRIFLTDPAVFPEMNIMWAIQNCAISAIKNLNTALLNHGGTMEVYFLPLMDLPHVVLTDQYLLLQDTLLYTRDRGFLGSVLLFNSFAPEYGSYRRYLEELTQISVEIHAVSGTEYDVGPKWTPAEQIHRQIRNMVGSLVENGSSCTSLHKVYLEQLRHYAAQTFAAAKLPPAKRFYQNIGGRRTPLDHGSHFDPANYLPGDATQKALLPYLRETEELLTRAVHRYDRRPWAGAAVIPAANLGLPNNVTRLAGGFAGGMLVDWDCGMPIVPIDAAVNVCTGSIIRIDPTPGQLFNLEHDRKQQTVEDYLREAQEKGYSCSFTDGNHFLMLAQDEEGRWYLVLHTAEKNLQESFFGLYATEESWYSDHIKVLPAREGGRCLRFIKDEDAKNYVRLARSIQVQNRKMHLWWAEQFGYRPTGRGADDPRACVRHHFYMPTDHSIALGAYVEQPGTVVPLFSRLGKPVCLARIREDNRTYDLDGKQVCVVPHGFGRAMEGLDEVRVEGTGPDRTLILKGEYPSNAAGQGWWETFPVGPQSRISGADSRVRDFEGCEAFLNAASRSVKMEIVKTLYPRYIYCQAKKGWLG